MTAREHAERASGILGHVESMGRHPGSSKLARFRAADRALIEMQLQIAMVHALTAQALTATEEGEA